MDRAEQNASRSRERGVLQSQGCGFSLFSSCSALLSRGQIGRPTRRRPRGFPVCVPPLTGKGAAPGCGRPPAFLLLFTGKYRAAEPRSHVADAAAHHYLYAVSAGLGGGGLSALFAAF